MCRRARKELAKIFSRIIQARRESNTKEDDMLQSFIESRYEKVSSCCYHAPHLRSFLAGVPGSWTCVAAEGGLQWVIDAQVHGGRYLSDEEITGMLIATLFAGQHTSSITSSWTGLTMIRDKVGRLSSPPYGSGPICDDMI